VFRILWTVQCLQDRSTLLRLLLGAAFDHFRSLDLCRDPAPGAFFFGLKSSFVFRRSSFSSRIASASFAFARCLISRSSPVSAMLATSLSQPNLTAPWQPIRIIESRIRYCKNIELAGAPKKIGRRGRCLLSRNRRFHVRMTRLIPPQEHTGSSSFDSGDLVIQVQY
jgi:hypothetical protein